ncbi:MAG: hypothetical protein ACFFCS_00220 [Candidatus Hodarchaeota archaeon]
MERLVHQFYRGDRPSPLVKNVGLGPLSGGLWTTACKSNKYIILSIPDRTGGGGVTAYKIFNDPEIVGSKIRYNYDLKGKMVEKFGNRFVLGGPMVAWPGIGLVTYDFSTGFMFPVDDTGLPIPLKKGGSELTIDDTAYPFVTTIGVSDCPSGRINHLSIGDVTGNGFIDVVIAVRNWERSDHYPEGKRWGAPGCMPYEQRKAGDPGNDPTRDEANPYWGSRTLNKYLKNTRLDSERCTRASCKDLWGGWAGKDELCTILPLEGPWEYSLERKFRGGPARCRFAVFKGTGEPANLEEDDDLSHEYAGTLKDDNGNELTTFSDSDIVVLPNGDIMTNDFVGELQYFRNLKDGKLGFKELKVNVENGYIPAIHGCMGTISLASNEQLLNPQEFLDNGKQFELLISGEFGLVSRVKGRVLEGEKGVWIQPPDDHIVQSEGDSFKEDILAVPTFLDEKRVVFGSGAGRYTMGQFSANEGTMKRLEPFNHVRVQAGPVGSVQGTTEEKWGYTTPCAFDWAGNGKITLVSGDISEYIWLLDEKGTRTVMRNEKNQPLRVGWRVRPSVFEQDGEVHIIALDREDNVSLYKKIGVNQVEFFTHVNDAEGKPFGFGRYGGSSGRLKFEAVHLQGHESSVPSILMGTVGFGNAISSSAIVLLWPGKGSIDDWRIQDPLYLADHDELDGKDFIISFGRHSAAPAIIPEQWDGRTVKKGKSILVGAEDGRFYFFPEPRFLKKKDIGE